MKKQFIVGVLIASSAWVSAESVQTTEEFRYIMKREYHIEVPKILTAGSKAAKICYGIDDVSCNKLYAICEESQSKGCQDFLKTLEKLAKKEYDKM